MIQTRMRHSPSYLGLQDTNIFNSRISPMLIFFWGGGSVFVNFSIHPPRKLAWKHKQNEGLEVVQDSVYSFSFGRKGRCLRISMFIFRGKLSRLAITKFRSKRDHPRSTLSSILYAWKRTSDIMKGSVFDAT